MISPRAAALAIVLSLGAAGCEDSPTTTESNAGSTDAGDWSLPDLQGVDRRISDWRGKVVLVNFWATWCAPCLREMPALSDAREKYADQGFEVLGVAIDRKEPVLRFISEHAIEYPILDGEIAGMGLLSALGNEHGSIPYSVMVDRNGTIALRHLGELTPAQIEAEIERLL